MSRSGYCDEIDNWALIRWRGAVSSALRGKRGQALLHDLVTAMDVMSEKRLIHGELEGSDGYCALGVVGVARGINLESIDPYDSEQVADAFGIAKALAKEIVFENDEGAFYNETPEQRWKRIRCWADRMLQGKTV